MITEEHHLFISKIVTSDEVPLVNPEVAYWNEVLSEEQLLDAHGEWLRASRGLYAEWIRKYCSRGRCSGRVLKTDAFEEIRGAEVVQALEERFASVVMTDLAFPALAQSVRKLGGPSRTWVQALVQELPFATASFGGVVSLSTLDHFQRTEEIGQALGELARVTRPGGPMLLTLDNGMNPVVAFRNAMPHGLLSAMGIAPYHYGKTLGPGEMRRVLVKSGWRVNELTAVLHAPRVLAVATAARFDTGPRRQWFDGMLRRAEWAERLPTRFLTGYFLLASCVRND